MLKLRASLLETARRFFAERGVLEVETPALARGLIVDAHIDPIICAYAVDGDLTQPDRVAALYLSPSPEAAMKRLLAAGSGPIYQIARVFRAGERGRHHNPEFTLLEWYRPGFDHHELMEEVGELIRRLLGVERWEKRTYREVFEASLAIDPLACENEELVRLAACKGLAAPPRLDESDRHAWLDLLLSVCVQPQLGRDAPVFVYDYPPSQAALAKIGGEDLPVGERFELFYRGVELCNGYHELTDPREHRLRFQEANLRRTAAGKQELPVDTEFLAAVDGGLPSCAGVALGFDRVVMLAAGVDSIGEVIAFPFGDDHVRAPAR